MKKFIKIISLTLMLALAIPVSSLTVFAANNSFSGSVNFSKTGAANFKKTWEVKRTYGDGNAIWIKYGFNTYLIDEDYVKGYHPTQSVTVQLKRGSKMTTKKSSAGKQVILEGVHNTTSVYYYMSW